MQCINQLAHTPPFSFLTHGAFWSLFLVILSPLAGLVLLLMTGWKVFQHGVLCLSGIKKRQKIDPLLSKGNNDKEDLAVLITGCGAGFGRDLAFALSKHGFTVFACCRSGTSLQQFEDCEHIIPVKLDVTVPKDVKKAVEHLSLWLDEGKTLKRDRHFHALVNNAGIGKGGRLDWDGLDPFRHCMEGENQLFVCPPPNLTLTLKPPSFLAFLLSYLVPHIPFHAFIYFIFHS